MAIIPAFQRYIGIDYSGAETPTSSLKGLRVYVADQDNLAEEVQPPQAPANTGRGAALPNGCWKSSPKRYQPL